MRITRTAVLLLASSFMVQACGGSGGGSDDGVRPFVSFDDIGPGDEVEAPAQVRTTDFRPGAGGSTRTNVTGPSTATATIRTDGLGNWKRSRSTAAFRYAPTCARAAASKRSQ